MEISTLISFSPNIKKRMFQKQRFTYPPASEHPLYETRYLRNRAILRPIIRSHTLLSLKIPVDKIYVRLFPDFLFIAFIPFIGFLQATV